MPIVTVETLISATPETCFDLARDMKAHAESTKGTNERIVECPPSGLLELGDEVEFEASHFGIKQRLRSKIVEYERPLRFVDQMQKGAFKRLRHIHSFEAVDGGTRMVDVMDFASPFGFLGAIADNLFLANYMKKFLAKRNQELKQMAESK